MEISELVAGMQIEMGWPREDMRAPHLDILKRQNDGGFVWIEAASDVQGAEKRISKLADEQPGEYFVFDQRTQQIVAKVARQPTS
jgi:hypothetical protein